MKQFRQFILISLLLISSKTFSQEPIFATIGGGDLYSFDITNCTRQLIGSTGLGFGDIAFTPDGRLWGIAGGELYQIDTATANSTLIGFTGVQTVSLVALNDSVLLGVYGMNLYGINIGNASPYYIDTIGYQPSGDLSWYDNDLYIVTAGSQIVKIILNNTATAILSVTPIGSSIPTCEGAVTASFVGAYNSIVGFNGPNLIKICQIDGTYQNLCPNLNIGGTAGAASIRLPTQIPQPTSCSMTGVENISANDLFSISPNPATNELNILINFRLQTHYDIYNALGQLVMSGILESEKTTIPLDNFREGLYSIELIADNKHERKSFIVQK